MRHIGVIVAVAILIGSHAGALAQSADGKADLTGRVVLGETPLPGAAVTATHDSRRVATSSGMDGTFQFTGLDDGEWTLHVEMRGFETATRTVTVPFDHAAVLVALTMQSYDEILGSVTTIAPAATDAVSSAEPPPDAASILSGSTNNGAASPFAQSRAFGNGRPPARRLYTGGVTAVLGNSAWNAQPYSFESGGPPSPAYGNAQIGVTVGGPMKLPWLVEAGPLTTVTFQHNIDHIVTTQIATMPTAAERAGDFSGLVAAAIDPRTGAPFPGNVVPIDRISPQAAALLAYYPLPNVSGAGGNYQQPLSTATTTDNIQLSTTANVHRVNTLNVTFGFRRTLAAGTTLFAFHDANRQHALNASLNWMRRINARSQLRFTYQFTQSATSERPYFANRTNVSGDAGIGGNSQDAVDWGPPSLVFPDVAGLTDAEYQHIGRAAHAVGIEASLRRAGHNLTFGGDLRRRAIDQTAQTDPRGTLTFTGAATGVPFADFLLGLPTTSAISFASAVTKLRDISTDAYFTDDWHLAAGLTMNLGVRWEYETPYTEASGHLANLDVAPDFAAVSPVLGTNPAGPLTGASYPTSLIRPDKRGIEPRVAVSWRPWLASSFVLHASYGLYRNLGVYEALALQLARQPPLATTASVQSTPLAPLTLANPFPSSASGTPNTFAVDPNLREGALHAWDVSAQRDLPASLTVIATYIGARGTHLMQAFLPNTYPAGAPNPCPSCPAGFVYVTSNGTSLRNAAQLTLRRRLAQGFTASVQYTLAKATDNAATFSSGGITPGSLSLAQNWLDLAAERGPSPFDQRHAVTAEVQYSTGQGIGGSTLLDGFWGSLYKDWTAVAQVTAASGLPLTPLSLIAIPGTGIVGVRPSVTGVSPAPNTPGSYVNPAAFAAPAPGTWGNAGRNSIRGPAQFRLDMNVSRTFRLRGRLNLDWRIAATNVLNRVTFASIGTVVTSAQFGLPTSANPMRTVLVTVRLRF